MTFNQRIDPKMQIYSVHHEFHEGLASYTINLNEKSEFKTISFSFFRTQQLIFLSKNKKYTEIR